MVCWRVGERYKYEDCPYTGTPHDRNGRGTVRFQVSPYNCEHPIGSQLSVSISNTNCGTNTLHRGLPNTAVSNSALVRCGALLPADAECTASASPRSSLTLPYAVPPVRLGS